MHVRNASTRRNTPAAVLLVLPLVLLSLAATASAGDAVRWLAGGHAGKINAVAFSPDGALIASASDDATIKLWSTNGGLIRTLITHPYQATAVAFAPNGNTLAAGVYSGGYQSVSGQAIGGLGRILIWESTGGWTNEAIGLVRTSTNHLGKITSLAFSMDGTQLASSGAEGSNVVQSVSTWNMLTRKAAFNTADGPSIAWSVAFSAAGLLASACEDGTIRVWNSSWSQIWTTNSAHVGDVTAVAFSADGTRMATAGTDATICIWSTTGWSCLKTLANHAAAVTAVAFSPDGTTLASASMDRSVKLWNVASGACAGTLVGHSDGVTTLAFSPDGNTVVSGSLDNSVRLWSATNGSLVANLTSHTEMVKAVAVSPDGAFCATVSNDECVNVRRVLDGASVCVLPGHTGCVSGVAFAPNSTVLATAGGPLQPSIQLRNVSDGSELLAIPATTNGVSCLAFSADGSLLASGGDADEQVIRVWDANSGTCVQTLVGHSNGVSALAFSPLGDLLVSGGRGFDNTVKLWSQTSTIPVETFTGHVAAIEAVAFSPKGKALASGSSGPGALRIHDIASGSSRTMGDESNCVLFVAFSPDGSTPVAACRNGIKLWDVATGTLSGTITQETARASCAAYSPNGNVMVCGREDGTIVGLENVLGAIVSTPLEFKPLVVRLEGTRYLDAIVQPQVHYVIESSIDLVNWRFLALGTSDTNTMPIIDSDPNRDARRFYRALTPP